MRLIAAFALVCLPVYAGTVVNGPLTTPFGNLNGRITISGPMKSAINGGTFKGPAGNVVMAEQRTYTITNGVFTTDLPPNDTLTPSGSYYKVVVSPTNLRQWDEIWFVPTSGSPKLASDVVIYTAPTPNLFIQPSQIAQNGASTNQPLCWNGTAWAPGDCGGSGSGSGDTYAATITSQSSATITHNLGSTNVIAACYETGGSLLSPIVTVVDEDSITLSFGATVSASCSIMAAVSRTYAFAVSGQTVTVTGTTHGLGHLPLAICTDSSGALSPMADADPTTFDIDLDFGVSVTGNCTLI